MIFPAAPGRMGDLLVVVKRGVSLVFASVQLISNFFVHFQQEKLLSVSSIWWHCSALNVFVLKDIDLSEFG